MDLFIVDEKGYSKGPALTIGTEEDLFNTPGHRFWYWGPTTAKQYKSNPEYYPDAFGVVDAGTRLRVHELREFGNAAFSNHSSYVRAEIVGGSYAGLIVELSQVSLYNKSDDERPVLVKPDPVFLRPVSSEPKSPSSSR